MPLPHVPCTPLRAPSRESTARRSSSSKCGPRVAQRAPAGTHAWRRSGVSTGTLPRRVWRRQQGVGTGAALATVVPTEVHRPLLGPVEEPASRRHAAMPPTTLCRSRCHEHPVMLKI